MKEIFVMLAKLMTKEQCIERLEESIDQYKEAKLLNNDVDQAENNLFMSCHLLVLNNLNGNANDIIKDMDEVKRSVEFFRTEKN